MNGVEQIEPRLAYLRQIAVFHYELDGGGRHLITDLVTKLAPSSQLLQIGCFLNGSVRRWFRSHPSLQILTIDPWDYDATRLLRTWRDVTNMKGTFKHIQDIDEFISTVEKFGLQDCALANVREFRNRYNFIVGKSPEKLYCLREAGYKPDIIYIDADKKPDDLIVCNELWPDAILTGDDYNWRPELGFPMKKNVDDFARNNYFTVRASRATWVLTKSTPSRS